MITNLSWNTTTGAVTVNIEAQDAPPIPDDGYEYSPPSGSRLAFDVPVKRANTDPPTIVRVETSPTGFVLTRLTWNGTAWVNPVRINQDGSLYTGSEQ
jgi:hypothetical protein